MGKENVLARLAVDLELNHALFSFRSDVSVCETATKQHLCICRNLQETYAGVTSQPSQVAPGDLIKVLLSFCSGCIQGP
jgi:hypothetical protein